MSSRLRLGGHECAGMTKHDCYVKDIDAPPHVHPGVRPAGTLRAPPSPDLTKRMGQHKVLCSTSMCAYVRAVGQPLPAHTQQFIIQLLLVADVHTA